ncbi:hypothetical protein B0H17DRAFT_1192999 [Mycena rosella]|uniref:F-box domain-containing protein n=1 Tax=Mycena rosella TaxID=1033263 RepID=A0AAD7GTZ8_MYCRO|nr:hypothetical protein B0H17DRAFT_1192999 [Mycena rosella]
MHLFDRDASMSRATLRANLKQLDTALLLCDVGPSEDRRALVQKRMSTQSKLDSIVYPVLTLPSEITSEIFIHCLFDTRARPNFAEAPLLLCNICSHWRTIAILTPALWSSIELGFKFSLFGSNLIDLLGIWLSRTGSHPLSLSLCYDEYTVTKRRQEINRLIKVLMRHSHQWADVELRLPDVSEFTLFQGHFPALHSLTVGHAVKPFTPAVTAFTDAPRLASVQLSAGCGLDPIVLPWPQLTVLKCESLHVCDCLRLLREMTRLVEFTVYLREGGPRIAVTPFILPALRSLHLLREECHMDLLQHLTLPALETLSISFESPDIPRFLTFLSRSACSLLRVIFDAWSFDQVELASCLAAMPSLRDLKLWRPQYFTDAFLLQLGNPALLLPNLQILDLNHVYPIQFTMPALVGMLASRWNAPVRLQSFRTVLHKASMVTDPETVFRLQALVASGMKIHIDYH